MFQSDRFSQAWRCSQCWSWRLPFMLKCNRGRQKIKTPMPSPATSISTPIRSSAWTRRCGRRPTCRTPTPSICAPPSTSSHMREPIRTPMNKDVVRFNFDTLYSTAWLALAREPIVLSVPDTGGRYYLLEMPDMWSDVFSVVGARTTGTKAGSFAIVALGWSGPLPADVTKIVAPTPVIWILGRTQTNGPADYANVHKVQDGYRLTPLSQWGKKYTPPANVPTDPSVDNKTPPQRQVNSLDGV